MVSFEYIYMDVYNITCMYARPKVVTILQSNRPIGAIHL